jgi:hypothetical protein
MCQLINVSLVAWCMDDGKPHEAQIWCYHGWHVAIHKSPTYLFSLSFLPIHPGTTHATSSPSRTKHSRTNQDQQRCFSWTSRGRSIIMNWAGWAGIGSCTCVFYIPLLLTILFSSPPVPLYLPCNKQRMLMPRLRPPWACRDPRPQCTQDQHLRSGKGQGQVASQSM